MTVFDHDTLALEDLVADFESSWSADGERTIARFLPSGDNSVLRERALWELVEADLELRIKNSQAARVEDYVEDFPALLDDQARLVEFVYNEYRLRSRRELNLTAESYYERFPILTGQLQAAFARHQGGGSSTTDLTSQAVADDSRSSERSSASSGRYRLIEPHDEGGLGKVWLAYDCELDRQVALKEIKTKYADDATSRHRFATEAMVTSSLEHPGIVPVYGLGQYADGRPYYTMRFVRGSSFREAIRDFHNTDWSTQSVGARRVERRRLLGHFLDVCNTIHYAHQRGVLHRDLKPGNIMLGDYGETLIVDWGLAKMTGQADDLAGPPIGGDRSDAVATRLGKALGSPAYMSPEQARGEHDQLGPATDVYSLGATLYTLLTNERPIRKGEGTEELLESVQTGDWPRPHAIQANVSRILEAICLKAMALDPEDRYQSARELGNDIERYLADQPVTAFRENLFHRFSRFVRRNDALVRAIAITLVAVAVTSFIAALSIDEQRRMAEDFAKSAEESRRSALVNKIEADKSFARAERYFELLDNAFRLAGEDETGNDVTLVEGLDRAVEQIEEERSERGLALIEFAKRYSSLRVHEKAAKYAKQATNLLTEALGPDHPETIEAMASLAEVLEAADDIEGSAAAREEVIARLCSSNGDLRPHLVQPLQDLANWYQQHDRLHEALRHQTHAVEILENLMGPTAVKTLAAKNVLAELKASAQKKTTETMVDGSATPQP